MTWASLIGPSASAALQGGDVEPVGLERHRHQLDTEPLQHQQRAVVGRLLDHHPVAGLEQVLEEHRPGLQRPVGDHHLSGVEPAVPLGDPLAEPRMADPGPVGERLLPVLGKRHGRRIPHRLAGAGCRRWAPRGQKKSSRQPCALDPSNAHPPPIRASKGEEPEACLSLGVHMTPKAQTRPTGRRERELSRLATRQRGVVARRQLLALGFGEEAIKLRLGAERLHAQHRGVFAVGHAWMGQQGRWRAAVLAYGDGALLSHRSAAALWGLARQRSGVIDVTAAIGRQGVCRRPGVFIHRGRLHPADKAERGGIPVTTVARTLFDLAEFVSFKQLGSAWEEADRLKLLQLREVEQVCERGYGRRALKPIRRLLAAARAPIVTRSPLEDVFAVFCRTHKLPTPAFNVEVLGYEVDALWPAERLAAELDSWEFHQHRAAFERDRTRDAALQAAGYRTIRITDRRLKSEAATVANQLRALLRPSASPSLPKPKNES